MKHRYLKYAAFAAMPLALCGCVDDNYDLSDIDTTTRIPVSNLTVPLNLKSILLDDVLDLSDNENITEAVIDGKKVYAIEKSGTFTSDDVSIDPVHVKAPQIADTHVSLSTSLPLPSPAKAQGFPDLDNLKVVYDVDTEMMSSFSFNTQGIDHALVAVSDLVSASPIVLDISFVLPNDLAANVQKVTFTNVKLNLPKGFCKADGSAATLNIGSYDPSTGIAVINAEVPTNGSRKVSIILTANKIDAQLAGLQIQNHAIDYSGNLGLATGGSIALTPAFNSAVLPSVLEIDGQYSLTSFDVLTVSGTVDYAVEGIDIDPIDLSDLPDFLADPETDIRLANPQIYLGATNTTAPYHTGLAGSLNLTSDFSNGETTVAPSPQFQIGWDRGAVRYNIAMAPNTSALNLTDRFPDAQKYTYDNLGNILASPTGNAGLPSRVNVKLDNLRFHGNAVNFPIRQNNDPAFGKIEQTSGDYTFFAPLAFQSGSQIIYAKTEDDLGTEDLDKITVNLLRLKANATTNVPLAMKISLAVFNKEGRKVGRCTHSITLPANSTNPTPIELVVESTPDSPITDIESIQYRAEITGGADSKPLSPTQYIKLDNLRLTVDGFIQTDF